MNNIAQRLDYISNILLEASSLSKLSALASDSCIIDKELQLEENIEYYIVLKNIYSLINQASTKIEEIRDAI